LSLLPVVYITNVGGIAWLLPVVLRKNRKESSLRKKKTELHIATIENYYNWPGGKKNKDDNER